MIQKSKWLFLLFGVFVMVGAVLVFGRVEFHNELERSMHKNVFLGYMEVSGDGRTQQWPDWTEDFSKEPVNPFLEETDESIGIFADLVYYENRYERRVWFTGKLLERKSEYYYRVENALYLKPVSERQEIFSFTAPLRGNTYDYKSFR